MTNEELDEARAKEAQRLWECGQEAGSSSWVVAARLAREGWTPPKPVDPDVLAWREWAAKDWAELYASEVDDVQRGNRDDCPIAKAYLAGARMAREQERERAKVLVEYVEAYANAGFAGHKAFLAKYRGGA